MAVRLVSETEEETERARLVLHAVEPPLDTREVPAAPKPPQPGRSPSGDLVEIMGILARMLGFRAQLFFAFLGAVGVGGYAVYQASPMSLVAAGMFNVMVFAPLAWIAYRRG